MKLKWPVWGSASSLACGSCGKPIRAQARFCVACGTAVSDVPAVPAPVVPLWRRPAVWIAAGVVIVGGLGVAVWTPIAEADMIAPVEAYFEALSAHDGLAAAAAAMADPGAESIFFADDGLATNYMGPSGMSYSVDYEIAAEVATENGDEIDQDVASIQIDYQVDGRAKSDLATVTRTDDGWVLTAAPMGLVRNIGGYEAIRIGTAQVDPADDIAAPPGIYEVEATGHGLYTDFRGPLEVDTYVLESGITQIPYSLRDSLHGDVEPQVTARIDECLQAGPPMDLARCPWRFDTAYDEKRAKDTTWTLEAYPSIEVAEGPGGVVVRTATPGTVTGTFTAHGLDKTTSAQLMPVGSVTVADDGQVVWTYERQ